jgi:aryl-alcohol dehydrogenase-like predicted oxidoreductase
MEYVNLGRTGLMVSRLCLGTMTYGSKKWRQWVLEEEESRPFLKRALELGINFFDTADMYSVGVSEEIVGRALRDFAGGRDRVVIATKVYQPMGDNPNLRGLSRKHIFHSIDDSLRRLGTDYVDLYQIHRFDYSTPIEETIAALDDVVRAGKVRYVGIRYVRLAVCKNAVHRRPAGARALRQHAESLQRGVSRGRTRDAAAVPRRRHRRDPVQSSGARICHGQKRNCAIADGPTDEKILRGLG